MDPRKLADEVNRLFDEMITQRWRQREDEGRRRDGTEWDLEIPLVGAAIREIAVSSDGRSVVVSVNLVRAGETATWRHSIALPHGALLEGVTTVSEGDVLHIRVRTRSEGGKGRPER